jgi:hypothetical protein
VRGDIPQALAATAGPAEAVPVAFLGRISNERLQDPVASMNRQVRNCRAWLPPGSQIVAYYWDGESGGNDLEDRSHSNAWQIAPPPGSPATVVSRTCGNVRDPEMPSARAGRRYKLRSRLYCSICHRRLSGRAHWVVPPG